MGLHNKCRLCAIKTTNGIELFSEKGFHLSAASIISLHFNIAIADDGDLSKIVCKKCWQITDSFHKLYCIVKEIVYDPTTIIDKRFSDHLLPNQSIKTEHDLFSFEGTSKDEEDVDYMLKEEEYADDLFETHGDDLSTVTESLSYDLPPKRKKIVRRIKKERRHRIKRSSEKISDKNDAETRKHQTIVEDKEISIFLGMNCELCQHSTDSFVDLIKHYRDEHRIDGYIRCCKRKYFRRRKLYSHIQNHRCPDQYKCSVCKKTFLDKDIFERHEKGHDPSTKIYKCSQCSMRYKWQRLLDSHILRVHGNAPRPYICDICNKNYVSKNAVCTHIMLMHTQQCSHICDVCAKVFKSRSDLNQHHKFTHTNIVVPREQCTICGAWLLNKHSLRKHIRRHEAKEEICKICDKKCPNKDALLKHVQYVHSGRLFQCNMCDKTFKSQITLKEHIGIHTGSSLYKCLYCSIEFRSSANMYKHRKSAHPVEWQQDRESGKRKKIKSESVDYGI